MLRSRDGQADRLSAAWQRTCYDRADSHARTRPLSPVVPDVGPAPAPLWRDGGVHLSSFAAGIVRELQFRQLRGLKEHRRCRFRQVRAVLGSMSPSHGGDARTGRTANGDPSDQSDCRRFALRHTRRTNVLDLEDLKARCLGNMDLVERVLSKFAGQLDHDLDDLEGAVRPAILRLPRSWPIASRESRPASRRGRCSTTPRLRRTCLGKRTNRLARTLDLACERPIEDLSNRSRRSGRRLQLSHRATHANRREKRYASPGCRRRS